MCAQFILTHVLSIIAHATPSGSPVASTNIPTAGRQYTVTNYLNFFSPVHDLISKPGMFTYLTQTWPLRKRLYHFYIYFFHKTLCSHTWCSMLWYSFSVLRSVMQMLRGRTLSHFINKCSYWWNNILLTSYWLLLIASLHARRSTWLAHDDWQFHPSPNRPSSSNITHSDFVGKPGIFTSSTQSWPLR